MKVRRDQIHNFFVGTARRLGLQTRVTLNNRTELDCVIDVTVRSESGAVIARAPQFAELPNDDALMFDLGELGGKLNIVQREYDSEELIFIFGIVPKLLLKYPEPYEIERKVLSFWLHTQDQYIEYYRAGTHFASGVNYAIAPLNDATFQPRSSNIVQAPKAIVSQDVNTYFQLIFFSSDPSPRPQARVHCILRSPSGQALLQWEEQAAMHSMLWIDIKEKLHRAGIDWSEVAGQDRVLYFQMYCADAGFASLALNVNEKTGTFAYEHTLASNYYFPQLKGARKGEIISYALAEIFDCAKRA